MHLECDAVVYSVQSADYATGLKNVFMLLQFKALFMHYLCASQRSKVPFFFKFSRFARMEWGPSQVQLGPSNLLTLVTPLVGGHLRHQQADTGPA